jgi:hypothetical protein
MTYLEMHWQTVVILVAAVLSMVIVLCGVAWLLWWRLPKRQMRSITAADPKARADIEDNFRKTIGQLLAVVGTLFGAGVVLIGAALAYLQFTQQQRASRDEFLKQQQASHDLLISNQVSKGFEQFGNKNIRVRLGGIYALEGVMNTSEQYYQPVLEALGTFVRDGTQAVTGDGPPANDIQAALTVIGRRKAFPGGALEAIKGPQRALDTLCELYRKSQFPNLAGAHIPKANLFRADLRCADLRDTDLTRANLALSHLEGARLSNANLSNANLFGANLSDADLTGAVLAGADAGCRGGASCDAGEVLQELLDQACGDAKLDPGLTLKPCPSQ